MANRPKGQLDLSFVADYLLDFATNLSSERRLEDFSFGSLWMREGEGVLELDSEEVAKHQTALQRVSKDFAPSDDLSIAAIDSALKDAVFGVVDIPGKRDDSQDIRIEDAMDQFASFLNEHPEHYECWVEVRGLRVDSLPATFGPTRFKVLGDQDRDRLVDIVKTEHIIQQAEKLEMIDSELFEELQGRTVAIQRVTARDESAALALAEREVQITADCLNFFAGLIPYNYSYVAIPKEGTRSGPSCRFTIADDGSFYHNPKGSMPPTYSMAELRRLSGQLGKSVKRVEAIRNDITRSSLDELLFRAVRWCGRSRAASAQEDKLLFSTVALECVGLPTQTDELRYRLSQRVARLLGDSFDDRTKVAKEVREIYDTRSAIVHSGELEMTEEKQEKALWVVTQVILRMLADPVIQDLTSPDALHRYFEDLVLS